MELREKSKNTSSVGKGGEKQNCEKREEKLKTYKKKGRNERSKAKISDFPRTVARREALLFMEKVLICVPRVCALHPRLSLHPRDGTVASLNFRNDAQRVTSTKLVCRDTHISCGLHFHINRHSVGDITD